MSSAGARGRITARNRGFVRVGGFYGRFRGRRTRDGELKFLDTLFASATVATTGLLSGSLNTIAQGDGESQRNGRKVVIKSIWVRGSIELNPDTTIAADQSADVIRVVLVQDKQCNGASWAVTDYLVSNDYQSFKNLENSGRFNTLWSIEMGFTSGAGVNGAWGAATRPFNKFIKCSIPIEFDSSAATGAITTQRSNSLQMLAITRDGVTAIALNCRIRYSDN